MRSPLLAMGSSAVAMAWATSPAVWRAATSRGQLVHDALQRVGCHHGGERGVVGRGDAAVHGCRGRMVGEFQVYGCWRGFAIDLHLESIKGRLICLARQALCQTRVYGHEAGGVGDDGALCCGEVRRQGVGL